MVTPQQTDPFNIEVNKGYTCWSIAATIQQTNAHTDVTLGSVISGAIAVNTFLSGDATLTWAVHIHEIYLWGEPGGGCSWAPVDLHDVTSTSSGSGVRAQVLDIGDGVRRPYIKYVWPEADQTLVLTGNKASTLVIGAYSVGAGLIANARGQYYIKVTLRNAVVINFTPPAIMFNNDEKTKKRYQEDCNYEEKMVKVRKLKAVTPPVLQ